MPTMFLGLVHATLAAMIASVSQGDIQQRTGHYLLENPSPLPWICQSLCSCALDGHSKLYHGNCSYRQLDRLPNNLSSSFVNLNFSHNFIENVRGLAFHQLASLQTLDLSYNRLTSLDEMAFTGLHSLVQLKLDTNRLTFLQDKPAFKPGVFVDLQHLRILNIKNNSMSCAESCDYPDTAFAHLKNLRELFLDGLPNKTFGPGFRNLSLLHTLDIGTQHGGCSMPFLEKNTFTNFEPTNLTNLTLQHCNIKDIHPDSFLPLKVIHTINFEWNRLTFQKLKIGLTGLSTSPIKTLRLVHIEYFGLDFRLPSTTFEPIKNTNLTSLVFQDSGISKICDDFIKYLPSSLENLDLSENNIVKGKQTWAKYAPFLLKHLVSFNGCCQEPGEQFHQNTSGLKEATDFQTFHFSSQTTAYMDLTQNLCPSSNRLTIPLPSKLRYFYLQNNNLQFGCIPPIIFLQPNSISHIDISNNKMELQGPLLGLHKLRIINLSNGQSSILGQSFFQDMPSLEQIILANNNLNCLANDTEGHTFSIPGKLKHLDLSNCNIETLHESILKGQHQLQTLVLRSNSLKHWQVKVGHMTNLQNLDLSHNQLTTIESSARGDLEVAMRNSALRISFLGNQIQCSCENLEFLRWLDQHQKFFILLSSYTCTLLGKKNERLANLPHLIKKLELHCLQDNIIIASSVSFAALILIITLTALLYRHRWKVRFLKNQLALRLRLYQPLTDEEDNDVVSYDAFLSYEDSLHRFIVNTIYPNLEQQRGLQLCIHTRDFMPGTAIAINIYRAVHYSKKTITFITEAYFRSEWCMYELEMAYLESVHTGRQKLLPVLMEQIDFTTLPRDIQKIFQSLTYLDYTNMDEEQFLQRTAESLQSDCDHQM
ncbi:toll-like receptor 4 [Liolophura sinensis]|uniref:toll-like receptor 4 n=1 Tax=Liolophura sinensis TaxID=3198878 RepID=UPI003158CB60